nr:hypothetical protein [Tanacetum cinerariifolium]
VEKLTKLQIKSLSPELFNLLSSHDFSSSLPTELKELPSKFTELIREIKELKKHVHELEVELPGDLKEIITKLEKFSSTIFSLTTQVNIKTLDAILSIFFKVNKTLDSSPKNSPQPEGELIKKDKGKKAMSSKDAKEKGTESETNKETNLTDPMKKRIKESVKADLVKQEVEIGKEELVDLVGINVVKGFVELKRILNS